MNLKKTGFLKIYLAFFLPVLSLSLVFSTAYYTKEKNHTAALLEKREAYIIEKQQILIEKKIFSIVSDLKTLAAHHELTRAASSPENQGDIQALAYEFLHFCKYKTIYDQIRFIDQSGHESVRINYNNGIPVKVPSDQLQDKSKRYYFLDTLRLGENEIFISPFDLNIENGKIEEPPKPMIRFATPVFTRAKKKVGIIVLNYFGMDLFNDLEAEQGKIMLVNAQGYWLKGLQPEDEWGFMTKGDGAKNMKFRFPDAWQQISGSDLGQFYTGNGLFTFSTIMPVSTGMKSSRGSADAYVGTVTPEVAAADYCWKIIAWVSPESLSGGKNELLKGIAIMNGSFLLLLVAGCFFIAREFQKRKTTDLDLRQTKATMQSVFNSVIPICVTNFDYKILLANGEYNKAFNTSAKAAESPERCFQSRPSPICKTEACPLIRIADGEEEVTFETTKTTGAEGHQHFIVTARPLYNAEGIPVGIVESFQDITERDKLEKEVKTLSGFLPICASCKKIRDDKGYWNQIESYISSHSDAEFSHGICPDCVKEIYPEQYKKIFPDQDED